MKICIDAEGAQMFALQSALRAALTRYGFSVVCTRLCPEDEVQPSELAQLRRDSALFLALRTATGARENENQDAVCVRHLGRGEALAQELGEVIAAVMGTQQPPLCSPAHGKEEELLRCGSDGIGLVALHSYRTNARMRLWLAQRGNVRRLAQAEAALVAEYFGVEAPERRYELLKDVREPRCRATLEKLLARGLLEGDAEQTVLGLGEDALRLLALLDRAGLFDLTPARERDKMI